MIQITFNEINTYKALKLYNTYAIIPKEKLCILIIFVLLLKHVCAHINVLIKYLNIIPYNLYSL